jgi:tetratricopeptide (TPR) repeat protein
MLAIALRAQNIEIIIKMGFYIKDLHEQIKKIDSTPSKSKKIITYRGQVMANAECEKLKKNIGCLIAFNSFLSTTTSCPEALLYADYAQMDHKLTGIVFQMEIDPSTSTIPFVSLSDFNNIPFCENEILFSMHTVFRVDAVEEVTNSLWMVDLTLTSDTDDQFQRLAARLRKEIEGPNPLHRLANLLIRMGEFDKAEEIFKTLFETTSNVDVEQVISFYNHFGYICKEKGNFFDALSYHQKALEMQQKSLPANHPSLAESHHHITMIFDGLHQYSEAVEHALSALKIARHSCEPNQSAVEKYQQYLDEMLLRPECSELAKIKNINE